MQSINREVQNTLFFICFFCPLLLLPITAFLHYNDNSNRFILLLIATACYLIGVFGVTVFGNVPLNNQLEQFDFSIATEATIKQMRNIFEKRWNFLNNIRTVSALFALIFILFTCIMTKGK
ncbi:DUF1772 domain-containing protein [Sphingobacterium sp. SRCM116780]|uniref:anthrone oxygenase family protein n=1 Tax=Sphingobacterium sp. SRCM116780 TaxID=2907623 RepID=UPI001F160B83|nr:DUF1772 domain-containing protein [Sphingobacterium sp. SRCM116780]UIR57418.1 DUF1772 domain-containing protein [Sphingobacterium sp. SRCM116780]